MSNVLIIAGIKEARLIVDEMSKNNISLAVAVTSRLGKNWLKQYDGSAVLTGRLTLNTMLRFIEETKAVCIVDASLPASKDISVNALSASKIKKIPYLRFECTDLFNANDDAIPVKDTDEAIKKLEAFRGNVLLAAGIGKINAFSVVPDFRNRFYAWVFPESSVIAKCESFGLNAGHIIAMKGPFNESLYMQILKHCNAEVMVIKDNGNTEGNLDKINAAKKSGVPLIMLERAKPESGEKVSEIKEVLEFVQNARKMTG